MLQYCFLKKNKLSFKIVFVYFWLHQVFVVAWGGYSLAMVFTLLTVVASRCEALALGKWASVVVAH